MDVLAGRADTRLQIGDGDAESLRADQHVACLAHLQLVSVLSEECTVRVKGVNSVVKVGCAGVSR